MWESETQEKKGKYVATINMKVVILNTGLWITCVLSALNAAGTVFSVLPPYLIFRVAFMSLGEVAFHLQGSLIWLGAFERDYRSVSVHLMASKKKSVYFDSTINDARR